MKIKKVYNIKTMTIMKKITFILSLLFAAGFAAHAQTDACESGFCPETITAHHHAGVPGESVAPEDITITYKVIETNYGSPATPACWITQNLGATEPATSETDNNAARAGWYWQFNRKQGYYHDGTTRTPNTTWLTAVPATGNWTPENDPCTILLGAYWHIPTPAEWIDAKTWTTWAGAYSSVLKMHKAGQILGTGSLSSRGSTGYWWSKSTVDSNLATIFDGSIMNTSSQSKTFAYSVRCVRTFSW